MRKKSAIVHVRVDSDLEAFLAVLKDRPGGISRFICDALRTEMKKTAIS